MKSSASQLPTDMLLSRARGPAGIRRGQMPVPKGANDDQAAVGRAFEELLLREMVKAMQKSIPQGSLMPSGPSKGLYEHMMQQAMVENLSGSGGLGIAEALQRSQNTLRRSAVGARVHVTPAPGATQARASGAAVAQRERARASFDSIEHAGSTPLTQDLGHELPPQDDSWIDSPFAEAHLRRLLSTPSDRKQSSFPFKRYPRDPVTPGEDALTSSSQRQREP